MKIIILNAPPRSGKDYLTKYVCDRNNGVYHCSFKNQLVKIALSCATKDVRDQWYERYETKKDIPWKLLNNYTQREYLQYVSEKFAKVFFGNDFFGKCALDEINKCGKENVIFSDGGFTDEIKPLVNEFGKDNVYIIQWGAEGCSFENDTRDYIVYENAIVIDDNDFTKEWAEKAYSTIMSIYEKGQK